MSQLDVSITFSHFFVFAFCFYVFLHYITVFLIKFWYNQKLRSLEHEELSLQLKKIDNTIFIKRILKL
uniref:ATP synthase F0 subunit 8 n=1 Tax=Nemopsis bachei TaxID=1104537 RepID=G9ISU8_9CNID|nr:ATP synthase F0 subunit 8 [Nemopsis bachei]